MLYVLSMCVAIAGRLWSVAMTVTQLTDQCKVELSTAKLKTYIYLNFNVYNVLNLSMQERIEA